jgi:simple sugar transport system substrate-binding protein
MKKQLTIILLAAILLTVVPFTISAQDDGLEIIFVTHDLGAGVFAPVRKGMEDACAQIGASCEFLGPQTYDPMEHVALLEAAIARGPDGIATTRPEPGTYDDVLQRAVDAGIAVVVFNTNDPSSDAVLPLPFVGQNFTNYGRVWARVTMDAMPDGGTIAVTNCCAGHYALEERIRSFQETLELEGEGKYEVVQVIITGAEHDGIYSAIEAFYSANSDIDAIVGSDFFTYVIAEFLVANGLQDDVMVAGEMSPFMEEGLRQGFVPYALGQGPYLQGYYPVHMIRMQVELGIQPTSIDSGTDVISPDNIDQWNPDFR